VAAKAKAELEAKVESVVDLTIAQTAELRVLVWEKINQARVE
jgi:hypothetical protein